MSNPERQARLREVVRRLHQAIVDTDFVVIKECLHEITEAIRRTGMGGHLIMREIDHYIDEMEEEDQS